MRAIYIDPFVQTVSEIETSGEFEDLNRLPGVKTLLKCESIVGMTLPPPDEVLYLDNRAATKAEFHLRLAWIRPELWGLRPYF
jgi:hypothetical protein